MDNWEPRVRLDRKPSVRSRNETAPPDTRQLRDEPPLIRARTDVFDHSVGVEHVERAIIEGQIATVGADERDAGIEGAERFDIVNTDGGHLIRIRIAVKEVVLVREVMHRRDADVEDAFTSARRETLHVRLPLLLAQAATKFDC